MPVLSVIVPVYNAEKYLEECVNSILKQPCKDLEIILVNDGSQDRSKEIAEQIKNENKNVYVYNVQNGGAAWARNIGMRYAVGNYISFLDADDVWCKDFYTDDICEMLKSENYDIVGFSYIKSDEKLEYGTLFKVEDKIIYKQDPEFECIVEKNSFCANLYARNIIKDVQFPEKMRYGEDLAFLILATRKAKKIATYDKCIFVYRMNFDSLMNRRADFDFMLEAAETLSKVRGKASLEEDKAYFDSKIYKMMYNYIRLSCKNGKKYQELHEELNRTPAFVELRKRVSDEMIAPEEFSFVEAFDRNPKSVRNQMRRKGIIRYSVRRIIKNKVFSKFYYKYKYRTNISQYIR